MHVSWGGKGSRPSGRRKLSLEFSPLLCAFLALEERVEELAKSTSWNSKEVLVEILNDKGDASAGRQRVLPGQISRHIFRTR
ncbi:hypothetical protein V6N12_007772 [Hibiscus sabdariffa]|uniref:Uncharacterized protein n=1 Tax=Hibiscus sabdariffa TaxID=183260 RepID=A0ABR2F2P1_9ROSI